MKKIILLLAFLVTWEAFEGSKIEPHIRFEGDKKAIGSCVCKVVEHFQKFNDGDEFKAVLFATDLKSDPRTKHVQVWKLEPVH